MYANTQIIRIISGIDIPRPSDVFSSELLNL